MLVRRTWAIAHKELRHIGRNRLTLFLVTISPAMLLFLLAYVFSFNVDTADLAVMNLSQSQASRSYINALTSGSKSLRLAANVGDYETIDRMLIAGTVDAAIVIPPDFSQGTASQGGAIVQVIVDGSNPIIAGQIIGMISRASALAGADLRPALRQLAPAFELRSRAWYNDTLNSQVSMVPGLMGIVLSLPALALSLSLTREKELGTLEGLMATPIEGTAYLVGKTSAYILTGLSGLVLSWLVAVGWFKVPFRGDMCAADRADGGVFPGHDGHQLVDLQPHLEPTDGHVAGDAHLLRAELLPGRPDRPHRPLVEGSRAAEPASTGHPLHRDRARPVPKGRRDGNVAAAQSHAGAHGRAGPGRQHGPVQKEAELIADRPPRSSVTSEVTEQLTHSLIHHSSLTMLARTWQVIVKELLHFRRDRVLTAFLFVFPVLQLVLVAQTAGSNPTNLPLAVFDQDNSPASRLIVQALDNTSELGLRYLPGNIQEVERLLDTGQAALAVIIPPRFAANLDDAGASAQVQIIVDGSNVSSSGTALSTAEGAITSALYRFLAGRTSSSRTRGSCVRCTRPAPTNRPLQPGSQRQVRGHPRPVCLCRLSNRHGRRLGDDRAGA